MPKHLAIAVASGLLACVCLGATESRAARTTPPQIRVAEGRVTLVSGPTPLEELLRRLAEAAHFELELQSALAEPTVAEIEDTPLPRTLALLLGGIPHRVDVAVDPRTQVPRVVRVRVSEAVAPASASTRGPTSSPGPPSPVAERPPAAPPPASYPAELTDSQLDLQLFEQLESAEPTLRAEAATLLQPEGEGLARLVDLVAHDPDPEVRVAAVENLEGVQSPVALRALVVALRDPDRDVVLAALEALEFSDDPRLIPDLAELESHPDPEVRRAAREAVELLEP